jgi:hypothetical protein
LGSDVFIASATKQIGGRRVNRNLDEIWRRPWEPPGVRGSGHAGAGAQGEAVHAQGRAPRPPQGLRRPAEGPGSHRRPGEITAAAQIDPRRRLVPRRPAPNAPRSPRGQTEGARHTPPSRFPGWATPRTAAPGARTSRQPHRPARWTRPCRTRSPGRGLPQDVLTRGDPAAAGEAPAPPENPRVARSAGLQDLKASGPASGAPDAGARSTRAAGRARGASGRRRARLGSCRSGRSAWVVLGHSAAPKVYGEKAMQVYRRGPPAGRAGSSRPHQQATIPLEGRGGG